MWRWSSNYMDCCRNSCVFSTYVEVIPRIIWSPILLLSILHVCGGDPRNVYKPRFEFEYSPRMWRWSLMNPETQFQSLVFSTYVEVILKTLLMLKSKNRILHVCGGDPIFSLFNTLYCQYSPRMWRWSSLLQDYRKIKVVFSTYVEVILIQVMKNQVGAGILHVCGGDPGRLGVRLSSWKYSPRMWRWSFYCKNL